MTDDLYHRQLESIKLKNMATTDLVDMLRERDKRIENLERGNAELKKRNGELAGQKASLERWFGEAKKIIQNFVWWHTGEDRGSIDSNNLVERAEQFLKEDK